MTYIDGNQATPRVAAFFDLDKTVVATSAMASLIWEFIHAGLVSRRKILKLGMAHLAYHLGSASHLSSERLRKGASQLVAGWDVDTVAHIVTRSLNEKVQPTVFVSALQLMDYHRNRGRDIVLVSASARELVEPLAEHFGASHALATIMRIENNRYTGDIDFYCYGSAKAEAMQELASRENYDLSRSYAYSDSVTDLPMLHATGHAGVINPGRALKRAARENGWKQLRFRSTLGRNWDHRSDREH